MIGSEESWGKEEEVVLAGLMQGNAGPGRLREMLAGPAPVLAPGAYDALSARLVEEAGFGAVYMTGLGTAASSLGRPDVGLLTMSEMVDHARRMVKAVEVPVIADADNGYGNPINVIRAVQEYEAAGVSAIHIEDQVFPKKCGHMEGKEVVSASEMVEKVGAAVEARRSEEFVIIARTDARAVEGIESAVERARRYREAGADLLFVEAPQSEAEISTVAEAFPDVPLLFNWVESGKTPPVPLERLMELGFRLIIFPVSTLLAVTVSMKEVLAKIKADGTPIQAMERLLPLGDFIDLIGLPEIREIEERLSDEKARLPR
ncbi:MAG TPA: isocitrate lyase/PEP mutase family protein [Rubrobacteraceae bacterium]|nr:isocitrate lyase/PEP mutase family protein [Rubrobacteraceae bacterium]